MMNDQLETMPSLVSGLFVLIAGTYYANKKMTIFGA